ncbi:hypothetical protein COU57_04655 [Candidatus Pacearchaeota archaeon CG10_big_fil_rev_8_21_14_0_10_32_14]|nr:MAG: hypothetical protein COU57_04655 [Candidatus Pacearchaeota archaeon CG10_big_fil_rev_8_21_14_0_10_32_14]
MVNILDMRDIRYINLFSRITKVQTRFCFNYNDTVIFGVTKNQVSKAIGKEGINVRRINEILKRKIKIIGNPEDGTQNVAEIKRFIEDIVYPVSFKDIEITENELILNAGSQSKAALIGRQRRRENELKEIIKDYFKKDLRIV